ncbi:sigma-E factor regulatory protein RseB [Alteromonas sp. 345S023]|uniref:Sigma-E factor regulatory protein RseB n=1 Tax=Alteromonas profundi TaxID=2696062 RepID=A0A7X5LML5_9ALTE|nr:MucB/RseB C-terminal domain-containing protein [Alteromonas profundi]NDV92165.1 sigma-E factor regulatory protein RseB [Alteromonas profundi]
MKNTVNNNVPAPKSLVRVFSDTVKQRSKVNFSLLLVAGLFTSGYAAGQQTTPSNSAIEVEETQASTQTSPQTSLDRIESESTVLADKPPLAMPDSTAEWLTRLSEVVSTRNFQVSFVQSRAGGETVPYLWRHAVMPDGTVMEQLNLQNGPGRELIRVGDIVSVFEPDVSPYSLKSEHINGPIPSSLLHHPNRLKTGYEFVSVGRARVAGRPAQQIRIVSRDNNRFSYQLWLDEETGMLLKLNMLDLQGGLLEQIQVTSMELTAAPDAYFERINKASLPKPMVIPQRQSKAHSWYVDFLPKGMTEVKQDTRRLALTGQVVEYKMYSDGLVDVSVYVQPAADALGSDLVLRNNLSTFLTLTDGKAQVTVVGEIPLQTANAMATSLTPTPAANP